MLADNSTRPYSCNDSCSKTLRNLSGGSYEREQPRIAPLMGHPRYITLPVKPIISDHQIQSGFWSALTVLPLHGFPVPFLEQFLVFSSSIHLKFSLLQSPFCSLILIIFKIMLAIACLGRSKLIPSYVTNNITIKTINYVK